MRFPDVEQILVDAIADLDSHPTTGTVTPPDLQQHLDFVCVNVLPGAGQDQINIFPSVQLSIFSTTRASALVLFGDIRDLLLKGPLVVGGQRIDRTITVPDPFELSWADPDVRRWITTPRFSARRCST